MAFFKEINPNTDDSHQVSPAYLLTFLRWENRSTHNYKTIPPNKIRKPMVVYNDAISITITDSKSAMSSTATIVLKCGDINYATAVHPSDFVIVNLVNWDQDAQRLRDAAVNMSPINNLKDGFKGLFKIQSVVKNLSVDKNSGAKSLTVTITAASHTEFNNVMYYNPAIVAAFRDKGTNLYSTAIGDYYSDKLKASSKTQDVVTDLFSILFGQSHKKFNAKVPNYGNTHFIIPNGLGGLINKKDAKYANEIYNYIVGIWGESQNQKANDENIGPGFNPNFKQSNNFFTTGQNIQGNKSVQLENWNNQTAWSILQANINSTLNEMYTSHRIGPDNHIYPTVVVRQKPFTSEHFKSNQPITKFKQLPTWKISPDLLYSLQTSRNEAARFNFVQVFTRQTADVAENDMSQQIMMENFIHDKDDIQRNGLKPYVTTSNFDFETGTSKALHAREWAQLVSDWIIDGHLKESGVLVFQGIQEPIAVGDNLELDGILYHIESISNTMVIMGDKKSWQTKITVSMGIDIRSNATGPVYPNMSFTDAQSNNEDDWNVNKLLPGISDTQNITGRKNGEEVTKTKEESFTPTTVNNKSRKK